MCFQQGGGPRRRLLHIMCNSATCVAVPLMSKLWRTQRSQDQSNKLAAATASSQPGPHTSPHHRQQGGGEGSEGGGAASCQLAVAGVSARAGAGYCSAQHCAAALDHASNI